MTLFAISDSSPLMAYNGKEIAAVYGDIVLDNLPPEDIKILENGIAFPTREEAEKAVEDYDG